MLYVLHLVFPPSYRDATTLQYILPYTAFPTLLVDVAAAFPSVARGCLLRKVRGMGLVRWTDSFMRDRRVIMSIGGQDGEPMSVTTGLP